MPNSLGIATNKLVAKIANDVGKAAKRSGSPPNALTVVPSGQEAEFLAPLPVEMLWGVGPKTAEKLALMEIHTIGDLAAISDYNLSKRFGKIGWDLARRAKGIDNRPIVTEREAKSISQEVTYVKDVHDGEKLRQTMRKQALNVAKQLKKQELVARTVKLKIRWPDFSTPTRQTTLAKPTSDGEIIAQAAIKLFEQIWQRGKAVRLIGVGVSGLSQPPQQLGLWDRDWDKERRIQEAIGKLQDQFGDQVISRGFLENEE